MNGARTGGEGLILGKWGMLDSSQVVYRRSFLFRGLSNITFGRESSFWREINEIIMDGGG